jgi:hypothetical protein
MRKPLTALFGLAILAYLGDCLIAHRTHPEVPWIESGIYCRGPFGFVATVVIVVVGIGYCLKKGY